MVGQGRDSQCVGGAGINRYFGREATRRTLGMRKVDAQPVDGRRPVCVLHDFQLRLCLGKGADRRLDHAQAGRQLHLKGQVFHWLLALDQDRDFGLASAGQDAALGIRVHLGSQPEARTLLLGGSCQNPGCTHERGQQKLAHGLHCVVKGSFVVFLNVR
jgi:hypothetical protein